MSHGATAQPEASSQPLSYQNLTRYHTHTSVLNSAPQASPPKRNYSQSRSKSKDSLSSNQRAQSPNWASLIPPMPTYPSNIQSKEKQQRHSIAISPISESFSNISGFKSQNDTHQREYQNQYKNSIINSSSGYNYNGHTSSGSASSKNIHGQYNHNHTKSNPNLDIQTPNSLQPLPKIRNFNSLTNINHAPSINKKKKKCFNCDNDIQGQFVRALNNSFHVECFKCYNCGNPCSSKFFPYDIIDPVTNMTKKVALCEYDYFKKLELICFKCNSALRGPYITALGNKYHLEHFVCSVCEKVFENDESFYEHENSIYCHYHYSKSYANHCEGCNSSIVKQFVELFKGGRIQTWHPECYMVHKFWNISISADCIGLTTNDLSKVDITKLSNSNLTAQQLYQTEKKIEQIVMKCWLTLSGFEETTASCISDMLLNACISNQLNGLIATAKLVLNIELLFIAIDSIFEFYNVYEKQNESAIYNIDKTIDDEKFQHLKKEPRNISGKIMTYLAILRKSNMNNSNELKSSTNLSTELLSVITGSAHYLKLLIRNGLKNALRANKYTQSTKPIDLFLNKVNNYELISKNTLDDAIFDSLTIPYNATDSCFKCNKSIENSCYMIDDKRCHKQCFNCSNCNRSMVEEKLNTVGFIHIGNLIVCSACSMKDLKFDANYDLKFNFEKVSDLLQLIYLLKIALVRSKKVMINEKTLPNKLLTINENEIVSKTEENYSKTLSDVTRLRSTRQDQKLSHSIKQKARKSIILETPEANKAKSENFNESDSDLYRNGSISSKLSFMKSNVEEELTSNKKRKQLRIKDEPASSNLNSNLDRTSDLLKNEKSLTLDDIPRIVAAEQAREHRPNAYRHHNSISHEKMKPVTKPVKTNTSLNSGSNTKYDNFSSNTNSANVANPQKNKYYSELTKSEHFIIRHIAIEALLDIFGSKFNKDELLGVIQTRKQPTFWGKFKFNNEQAKLNKIQQVFGVPLKDLTKKYGVESDNGVGPSKLRIPIIIDDCINALHEKDMSIVGIFRLNGNIKKLKELTDLINKNPEKSPDFSSQSAIQLAALMKKWLRELPDPLLTFQLYDLWISSQTFEDFNVKKRILRLIYCLLPRNHRDLLEVLLYFFSWVTSFAEIDDATGSKMDTHNLSTVITPNILYSKPNSPKANDQAQSSDDYFLAIEVVSSLIEFHDELCIIPEDLLKFFEIAKFNKSPSDITTKEILTKIDHLLKINPNFWKENTKPDDSVENFEMGKESSNANRDGKLVSSDTITRHRAHSTNQEFHGETVNE